MQSYLSNVFIIFFFFPFSCIDTCSYYVEISQNVTCHAPKPLNWIVCSMVHMYALLMRILHFLLGKLLLEVQPELMDTLIQATKDGDESRLNYET